ncbi:acetyl-CoA acetyltransferase [Aquihabitans sp. McL0605]|uniref:acetyl-CoA acetyltransferase n=1 Tax=Aquihabitans sp. McL0605 TaxID=3415671 RepID=UPI003CED792A
MGQQGIWVLGGYQSDFARNLTREGEAFDALTAEVVRGTLGDAGVRAVDVETVHVGNAFGQLFTGQGHLGAMPATVEPDLWGRPAARHEAACASGSIAILAAMAELEAGRYATALVVGLELERTVPGDTAAQHLGAASWVGHEGSPKYVWPQGFSDLADEYDRRYGLDDAHLHAFAAMAVRNARDNPNAQTRGWQFGEASFSDDDDVNPVVAGRTRRTDCSQVTDGGAGLVLATDSWVRGHPGAVAGGRAARITGWGHRTVGLPLAPKLERSREDTHVMPHVRDAFADALRRAGLGSVDDLSAVEVHDCFTASGYLAIDHTGIADPGESWKAIESGDIERTGRIPVNPGGGLIGGGHPVGATGVRMAVDALRQVTGTAGATQVPGARRVGTLNIGGSTATTCSLVLEGAPA